MSNVEYVPFGFSEDETSYPLNDTENRDELIDVFQGVFTSENSPYDENWSYEDVDDFLDWTSQVDYDGLIALDTSTGEIAGFTWGYRIDPEYDDKVLDPEEKFPDEIQEVGPEMYEGDSFMLDEIGVAPEYRRQGIGKELESRLLEKLRESEKMDKVMQRTQWSGENLAKLGLDEDMGFEVFTYEDGIADKPVLQEVEFVGTDGSDERAYLWKDLRGELE